MIHFNKFKIEFINKVNISIRKMKKNKHYLKQLFRKKSENIPICKLYFL